LIKEIFSPTRTLWDAESPDIPLSGWRLTVNKQAHRLRLLLPYLSIAFLAFLAFYNLPDYPLTWFDEGSHLHVPKTLVRYGVYADYSSEGFRYYGPTIGVGPTVMLPIALIFKLAGIGLLQARLVMALYLVLTVLAFFQLAYRLGGRRLAWVATVLLATSRAVSLVEYGRQVLGEVPGLLFMLAGLVVWFAAWEKASWRRLILAGLLLGLAMVTKYQYLLVIAPALVFSWLLNLVYYRTASQRTFVLPGLVAGSVIALWLGYQILHLRPATVAENLHMFRVSTGGAALVFSTDLMKRGLKELLGFGVFGGLLFPALAYGLVLVWPRNRQAQRWAILYLLVVVNLAWFVLASISWLRYAFVGLAFASLFVARFLSDLMEGFYLNLAALRHENYGGDSNPPAWASRWALLAWLGVMSLLPLGQTVAEILSPDFNAPLAMAEYMDRHVPRDALIETWEPEMGFLTDHNYRFPPPLLLNQAVAFIWLRGAPPSQEYDFLQAGKPEYVLVGEFARWVELYPREVLEQQYHLVTRIDYYELYEQTR